MALTATASQGFELLRLTGPDEVLYVPGDPGDTYTLGDFVVETVGEGLVDPAAADEETIIIGRVQQTTVCPAASTAWPRPEDPWQAGVDGDADQKTLVPINGIVPAGTPVFLVTFAGHIDDTVSSYVASAGSMTGAGAYIAMTAGPSADDYPNGALVYVYEGTGAGQWNVVMDFDVTGGTVEIMLGLHRPFKVALDSTSKYIVLAGEAVANRGVGFFDRVSIADNNNVVVDDGANDGGFMVYADARTIAKYLAQLKLPVVKAAGIRTI